MLSTKSKAKSGGTRGRGAGNSHGSSDHGLSSAQAQRTPAYAHGAEPAVALAGGRVQAKLAVSQPGDPAEREADSVADSVLSGGAGATPSPSTSVAPVATQTVEEEPEQTPEETPEEEERPEEEAVQRQASGAEEEEKEEEPEEESGEVQREASTATGGAAGGEGTGGGGDVGSGGGADKGGGGSFVSSSFGRNLGGGQPLPAASRGFFESRLGRHFGDVRVHTGSEASRSARSVDALAYTKGHDIVFGAGQYAPGTKRGDRLLAHELTHVVQQRGKVMRIQRQRVHMETGRFVGNISAAGNNVREEVLDVMDRLASLDLYSSSVDFYAERGAVAALAAGSSVPAATIPLTIAAISTNETTATLSQTAANAVGLTLTAAVGRGMTNNKADILLLQDMLLRHWHINTTDFTTERAAVNAVAAGTPIPDASIPKTIEGVTRLRVAYVEGKHNAAFLKQLAVSGEAASMRGSTMTWVPSAPGSGNTFDTWARTSPQGATPPLTSATRLNCWEMVLLAAFRAGQLSWSRIHSLYTTGQPPLDWARDYPSQMTRGPLLVYRVGDPDSPAPNRGQIVFWERTTILDHVALAEGTRDGSGRSQVTSFWPPPGSPAVPGTADQVKLTTIEQLVNAMPAGVTVKFASPSW